ncbi:hypothetical protein M9435_004647 [Picochlorum sp. BPE23]|nr:hypothetical protein M9435_004647 [Picochlorum sp. BPE23]
MEEEALANLTSPLSDANPIKYAGNAGETLIKLPGSIDGEGVTLKNLTDCTVYLLDYASEVEVFHCVNCQIFIGPVDGPALFQDCSNCHVAVASQQFQAKECSNCSFGLYCATGPTLSQCTGIRISSWSGSYHGLDRHFACAHLDPSKNQFDKVYDASQVEGENYVVSMEPGEPWVVDIPGLEEQQPMAMPEPEEEEQEETKPVQNDWIKAKHHGRNDDDENDDTWSEKRPSEI